VGSSPIARFGSRRFALFRRQLVPRSCLKRLIRRNPCGSAANRGSRDHDEVTEIQVSPTGDQAKDAARRFAEFAGFRRERVRLVDRGTSRLSTRHSP
jgi:acetyl-CoA acetyltransferase